LGASQLCHQLINAAKISYVPAVVSDLPGNIMVARCSVQGANRRDEDSTFRQP
jgi:hypothetical protein